LRNFRSDFIANTAGFKGAYNHQKQLFNGKYFNNSQSKFEIIFSTGIIVRLEIRFLGGGGSHNRQFGHRQPPASLRKRHDFNSCANSLVL
jgi:hypothetical protein